MTRAASLVGLLGLMASALPAHAGDPVVDALRAELDRSVAALALPGSPTAHTLHYDLLDVQEVEVQAQLGALVRVLDSPERTLGVGVRVGSPELDSANFVAGLRGDGFDDRRLVEEDHVIGVRHDAWLTTDRMYRQAVENHAIKQAALARQASTDDTPDYVVPSGVVFSGERGGTIDAPALSEMARSISAVFRDHPGVIWSVVDVRAESGRRVVLDNHGTTVSLPHETVSVSILARAQAPDGAELTDQVLHVARTPAGLPSSAQLEAEASALASRLEAWAQLSAETESYVGPVLFEGDAAVELFEDLFLPTVLGTPPPGKPPRGSRTFFLPSETDGEGGAMRPMRRVLPAGYTAVDDPQVDLSRPSSFTHDAEGVAGQRVNLVRDGIVRRHLSTCTPSEHEPESNGHARGAPGRLQRAMASNTTVAPDRELSDRKLLKAALAVSADYELDYVLVVRRLGAPWLSSAGKSPFRDYASDSDPMRVAPAEVVRRYADGHEEPVRGLALTGLDVRDLRDIVAAGTAHTQTRLVFPPGSGRWDARRLPVTLTVPSVVLSEVELRPASDNPEQPPPVGPPVADGA